MGPDFYRFGKIIMLYGMLLSLAAMVLGAAFILFTLLWYFVGF